MHVPLQLMKPAWQSTPHALPLQMLPAPHALPALPPGAPHPGVAPQKLLFVVGSTHVPPQLMRPTWQLGLHVPALQMVPDEQGLPADPPASAAPQPAVAPQYALLVLGSTHVPLQLIRPA
jgi:hypothetical protein